jgi:hypothetical protein
MFFNIFWRFFKILNYDITGDYIFSDVDFFLQISQYFHIGKLCISKRRPLRKFLMMTLWML